MDTKRYVGVVVKCNNKVLLCKRNNQGSFPGMWSIPAGKLVERGLLALIVLNPMYDGIFYPLFLLLLMTFLLFVSVSSLYYIYYIKKINRSIKNVNSSIYLW